MKRCPECRRDYTDETLNFCLDDGATLLDGPAMGDEPATAILNEPGGPISGSSFSESATRTHIHTTVSAAEPRTYFGDSAEKQSFSAHRAAEPKNRKLVVVGLIVAVLAAAGFFGYRYFSK